MSSPIIIKIGGFTNGMTVESVVERAHQIASFYEPHRKNIYAFIWDGDPFKNKGSVIDEKRGTPACFTHALSILHEILPEIPWVAAKREDQLDKLSADYFNTTKHGSEEVGCEGVFGPLRIVAKMGEDKVGDIQPGYLNVLTAPSDIHWAKLGVDNILFWKKIGYQVHYVTIGGGGVVTKELEQVGEHLELLWRLPTLRLSPVEGNPPDIIELQFQTKDPRFSIV